MKRFRRTVRRKTIRRKTHKSAFRRRPRRARRSQGMARDTLTRVRPSQGAFLSKRCFVKLDTKIRVTIPAAQTTYKYIRIPLNYFIPMKYWATTPWAVAQVSSPANPLQIDGLQHYYNPYAYQKAQVHAAKLSLTVKTQSLLDTGRAFIVPVPKDEDAVIGSISEFDYIESCFNKPYAVTFDYNSNYTERNNTRSCYVQNHNVEGMSKAEYNADTNFQVWRNDADGNHSQEHLPPSEQYFILGYERDVISGTTNGAMSFTVDLTYWVEFFDMSTRPTVNIDPI